MGNKDLAEKKLEDYNDVFADIFNTLLFGCQELDQQCLKNGPTASLYKAEQTEWKTQFRDTLKEYRNAERYVIAAYGIENQSGYDPDMPVRIMGYDYGSYRQQLLDKKKPLHPVVTIVLNFSDIRWNKNKSLHEMMQLSEQQKKYVQDYCIRVFDIAYLDNETIDTFQSDFKAVARFFKEKRLGNDPFKESKLKISHAEALLEFFSVFTGDRTYEEMIPYVRKEEGKEIDMCWVVQGYINEGKLLGLEQGKREGRLLGLEQGKQEGKLLGLEQGKQEGKLLGLEQGKQEEAELNARMFFKNGASMELVAASIQSLTAEKLQEIYEEVQAEKTDR